MDTKHTAELDTQQERSMASVELCWTDPATGERFVFQMEGEGRDLEHLEQGLLVRGFERPTVVVPARGPKASKGGTRVTARRLIQGIRQVG